MKLISYSEAAELFPGATSKKISQWLVNGLLPKELRISVGKSRYLDQEGLMEFLDKKARG